MTAAIRPRAIAQIFYVAAFGITLFASPAIAQKQGGSATIGLELDIPGFDPLKVGVYDTSAETAAAEPPVKGLGIAKRPEELEKRRMKRIEIVNGRQHGDASSPVHRTRRRRRQHTQDLRKRPRPPRPRDNTANTESSVESGG